METSQLICRANQLTGFYMMETLAVKGLKKDRTSSISKFICACKPTSEYQEDPLLLSTGFYKQIKAKKRKKILSL